MNHNHVNEEAMETTLAISSLWSGKNLLDPYKDHPIHKGSIDEEIPPTFVKQDNSFEDEDEKTRPKPNPNIYKPLLPYP